MLHLPLWQDDRYQYSGYGYRTWWSSAWTACFPSPPAQRWAGASSPHTSWAASGPSRTPAGAHQARWRSPAPSDGAWYPHPWNFAPYFSSNKQLWNISICTSTRINFFSAHALYARVFLKVLALKFQIPTGGGLMLLFLDGVDEREAACSFLVVVAAHVLEGAAAWRRLRARCLLHWKREKKIWAYYDHAVLRIHDILVWMRIRGFNASD